MPRRILTHLSPALEGSGEDSGGSDGGELMKEAICMYKLAGSHLHGRGGHIDEGLIWCCMHQENSSGPGGSCKLKVKISHCLTGCFVEMVSSPPNVHIAVS